MAAGPYGELLDAVRGVRWPARHPVPAGAPGAHQARSRGVAPEFAEYRPYRQGDDPRRIDWKLLARSDRAFIRLAPEYTVLGTTFVVDASASMDFPLNSEARRGKWGRARELAVGLAAVAHKSADPVGLIVGSYSGVRKLAPRTRKGVIGDIARTLDSVNPSGTVEIAPLIADSASRCVVITDCLGDIDSLRSALGRHRARGGEAHLIHIVSRDEIDPPAGTSLAVDPEDESIERPLVDDTRAEYRQRFDEFCKSVANSMRGNGVYYNLVRDDEDADIAIRRIVNPAGVEVRR